MRAVRNSKIAALVFVILMAAGAFAVNANKGSLQVNDSVSVNGKQLAAGDYSITWDGTGPDVQVTILKGKKVVGQTAARVVPMDQASNSNQAVVLRNANGSSSLKEIRLQGKKFVLDLAPGGSSGAAAVNSNN
jgi:hypothetical protein